MAENLLIDTDVHNDFKAIDQYIPRVWAETWHQQSLPKQQYANPRGGVARRDARTPLGGAPGSDPSYLIEHHLDPYDIDYAILTGPNLLALGPDKDYMSAIGRAYNECTVAEWFDKSDRFRGSILIYPDDPTMAVQEIHRWESESRFVQVIAAATTQEPLGSRKYWPIFEAAAERGLPFAVHPGTEGAGIAGPPTPVGWPSRYMEWHNILPITYMSQINSLVTEGVFAHFGDLHFVAIEGGTAWLPHLMWRMDKNYKALRDTAPWLRELPSTYILNHVRLTTQPIEEPRSDGELRAIFEMIDADHTVMFSSDYPHWDFDNYNVLFSDLEPNMYSAIMGRTAARLYNLDTKPVRRAVVTERSRDGAKRPLGGMPDGVAVE